VLYLKLIVLGVGLSAIGGGYLYVKNLQRTVDVLKENNVKLEQSVATQQAVIEQQKRDTEAIVSAMKEQSELNNKLNASIQDLENKFTKVNASGQKRDIGNLAASKPRPMERAINRGTKNALRCMEIAMGAPLTEKEQNAIKKSEINPECPDIANPDYVPYAN